MSKKTLIIIRVSIRAPAGGAMPRRWQLSASEGRFQSAPLREGRCLRIERRAVKDVSIRAPAGGAILCQSTQCQIG